MLFRMARRPASVAARDQKLIRIVDAAFADAAQRAGGWLACRLGCTQCCIGPFPINQLDVLRLRQGLAEMEAREPERAARIRQRAGDAVAKLAPDFPGNPATGILDESEEAAIRFATFADDEPCPVLDPATGACELYESRPMTCRVFGPPLRSDDGLGACELCFEGAADDQIAACELISDPDDTESPLVKEAERRTGVTGNTIVAFGLAAR
jgi:Fe-S-cluster containining protein